MKDERESIRYEKILPRTQGYTYQAEKKKLRNIFIIQSNFPKSYKAVTRTRRNQIGVLRSCNRNEPIRLPIKRFTMCQPLYTDWLFFKNRPDTYRSK